MKPRGLRGGKRLQEVVVALWGKLGMVHKDICPPQVYATSIYLHFKAFLA